jgi:hypothetical protein
MLLETRSGDVHVQQASTVRRRMSALGRALCTSCDTTTAPVAAVLLAAPAAAETAGIDASGSSSPVVPLAWSITQAVQTAGDLGPWRIRLMLTAHRQHVEVAVTPARPLHVIDEAHVAIPEFNRSAAGWAKGAALKQLAADECTTPGLLDPESVVVRLQAPPEPNGTGSRRGPEKTWMRDRRRGSPTAAEHAGALVRDRDYALDELWGTVGWVAGGALDPARNGGKAPTAVVSYKWTPLRLDSLILTADDKIELRQGRPYGMTTLLHKAEIAMLAVEIQPSRVRPMHVWQALLLRSYHSVQVSDD